MEIFNLDYAHMYANNVRFANAIFWPPVISVGVFTCIRMRSAAYGARFVSVIFSVGEPKYHIGMDVNNDFYCRIRYILTEITRKHR